MEDLRKEYLECKLDVLHLIFLNKKISAGIIETELQMYVFTFIRVYKNQNRACCETNQLISGNIDMSELPVDHFNLSQR